jgi:hypothetical protein
VKPKRSPGYHIILAILNFAVFAGLVWFLVFFEIGDSFRNMFRTKTEKEDADTSYLVYKHGINGYNFNEEDKCLTMQIDPDTLHALLEMVSGQLKWCNNRRGTVIVGRNTFRFKNKVLSEGEIADNSFSLCNGRLRVGNTYTEVLGELVYISNVRVYDAGVIHLATGEKNEHLDFWFRDGKLVAIQFLSKYDEMKSQDENSFSWLNKLPEIIIFVPSKNGAVAQLVEQ